MRRAAIILALLLAGCYEQKLRDEYAARGCIPAGREEQTAQPKKYCGKACFRYIQREYFKCGAQLEYFEY